MALLTFDQQRCVKAERVLMCMWQQGDGSAVEATALGLLQDEATQQLLTQVQRQMLSALVLLHPSCSLKLYDGLATFIDLLPIA